MIYPIELTAKAKRPQLTKPRHMVIVFSIRVWGDISPYPTENIVMKEKYRDSIYI